MEGRLKSNLTITRWKNKRVSEVYKGVGGRGRGGCLRGKKARKFHDYVLGTTYGKNVIES